MKIKCENCKCYREIPDEKEKGLCVYNPPVCEHGGDRAEWPVVYFDDWCAKHELRFEIWKGEKKENANENETDRR
jgi:hypothetical protein